MHPCHTEWRKPNNKLIKCPTRIHLLCSLRFNNTNNSPGKSTAVSCDAKQPHIAGWFTCRVFREGRPWNRKRCRPLCRRSRPIATGRTDTSRRGCRVPASLRPSTRRCWRPSRDLRRRRRRRRRLHDKPITSPLRHRYARHVFPARRHEMTSWVNAV